MTRPQVFAAGTWRQVTAEHAAAAHRVGVLIAEAGCDLASGPGTGVSEHVIAGFRSVPGRAGRVRFWLPRPEVMAAAGEIPRLDLADEVIQTDLDYPARNLRQVSLSQGVVVVTGSDGTLEEILPALVDYQLPVGVLRGSGKAAIGLELLLGVFPEWRPLVRFDTAPEPITRWVLDRISKDREEVGMGPWPNGDPT